ncbi:unnamed protein product [Trichobilharzia szidati]|nr:unnamed protein product [Trichobilharzia szidati]
MSCHLILHDVPENTEFGIDMKFWKVGKHFKGIKDIPLGVHSVYYSAVNSDCMSGQRVGFIANFSQPGFVVKRWRREEEDFIDIDLTNDEIERLSSNFAEVSMYLGQYPMESYRDWISLSNFITARTLSRLAPHCGRLYSCPHFLSVPSNTEDRLAIKNASKVDCSKSKNTEDLPNLKVIPGTEVRFTALPRKPLYPPTSSPVEITSHCMDQSYTLHVVLDLITSNLTSQNTTDAAENPESTRELLAEFQFAFLNLLLNHSIEGWEQWRRILQLLANCEKAIIDYPQLFIDFITVLYHQLNNANKSEEVESSHSTAELLDLFFTDSSTSSTNKLTEPGFLPTMLGRLLKNIGSVCNYDVGMFSNDTSNKLKDLLKRADGFASSIKQRFKWDLISSFCSPEKHVADTTEIPVDEFDWDGDEAPVIVQL